MSEEVVTIVGSDRLEHHIGASAALALFALTAGLLAAPRMGLDALITAGALAAAASSATLYTGIRRHRIVKAMGEKLRMLAGLLEEGVEGEPGRLKIVSTYTGELTPRLYTRVYSFRPSGDPQVVKLGDLTRWTPRYTLVGVGSQGILEAEAYRLRMEDIEAYLVRLHNSIAVSASRERLTVRRGAEYAEAVIDAEGPLLVAIVSHVGYTSRAVLELRLQSPIEAKAQLETVRRRSRRVVLPFAPYTPVNVLVSPAATPQDVMAVFNPSLVAFGQGIEARIRLKLARGPLTLDSDEAVVRTSGSSG